MIDGKVFRLFRAVMSLRQRDLAELMGVPQGSVSLWERGILPVKSEDEVRFFLAMKKINKEEALKNPRILRIPISRSIHRD